MGSSLCILVVLSTVLIAQLLPVQGLLFSPFWPAQQSPCRKIRLSLQSGIKAQRRRMRSPLSQAFGWSAGMLPLLPRCREMLLLLLLLLRPFVHEETHLGPCSRSPQPSLPCTALTHLTGFEWSLVVCMSSTPTKLRSASRDSASHSVAYSPNRTEEGDSGICWSGLS